MKRFLCVAMTVMLGWSAAVLGTTNAVRSFCWKATAPGKPGTVFVLGSVHVGTRDMYPMRPQVEQAFATSHTLMVEIDITKVKVLDTMAAMMYTPPDSLTCHVSRATFERVCKALGGDKTAREAAMTMKPAMAATMLIMQRIKELGYDPRLAVDLYFTQRAKDKTVTELESFAFQTGLLNSLGDQFLEYMLREYDQAETEFKGLIDTWKAGDAEAMADLVLKEAEEDPALKPFFDKLIFKRNTGMAEKIAPQFEVKGATFVVVGAAHLVGTGGILDLLAKKGCALEQVE